MHDFPPLFCFSSFSFLSSFSFHFSISFLFFTFLFFYFPCSPCSPSFPFLSSTELFFFSHNLFLGLIPQRGNFISLFSHFDFILHVPCVTWTHALGGKCHTTWFSCHVPSSQLAMWHPHGHAMWHHSMCHPTPVLQNT